MKKLRPKDELLNRFTFSLFNFLKLPDLSIGRIRWRAFFGILLFIFMCCVRYFLRVGRRGLPPSWAADAGLAFVYGI